tara:strand:+ start:1395 stop:1922 length:528 start_codon:yes stop_codon:yes gene_type:complete
VDFSLELSSGELVEIWGPNGSGKSTLLRCIAGLFEPDSGHATIERDSLFTYLGHKQGLSGVLTPIENLRWFAGLESIQNEQTSLRSALETVGMETYSHRLCGELSAGQLRRVALARLAVSKAKVWILDEPLTSLDQEGVSMLSTLIEQHLHNEGAVICATHQSLAVSNTRIVNLP